MDLQHHAPTRRLATTFVQLAATQPTSGFGEVFQYNNLMAVGRRLHRRPSSSIPDLELGAAYDAAMQEQIFAPLGMRDTTFDMATALAGDHASPHGDDLDGKPALASAWTSTTRSCPTARPAAPGPRRTT